MSGNHNGSLDRALQLVQAAAMSGATHLKIQTYTPDSITLNSAKPEFLVDNGHPLWGGKSLYDLYSKAFTPYEWHSRIFQAATAAGMIPFSTPFDEAAVDFLEALNCPMYKIASLEIVDHPLIAKVARLGKPLIISTGTASLEEVDEAVSVARSNDCKDLTVLVCTSDYPADPKLANLARLPFIRERYGCEVGLSDHTIGSHVAIAAIALGATVIEKHITLDPDDGGVDSKFSATPSIFHEITSLGNEVFEAIGSDEKWGLDEEAQSRRHRPSIIAVKEIKAGEEFTHDNIKTLRPNIGLHPKFLGEVLGKRSLEDIPMASGISFDHVNLPHSKS
jgi:N-acetylneuraminate synthase